MKLLCFLFEPASLQKHIVNQNHILVHWRGQPKVFGKAKKFGSQNV